jgi:large subunit ribosomal protein L32
MPVPKRKRSRQRRDKRFANKGMVMHTITSCSNCEKSLLPHTVCAMCGFYKGAKVLVTKAERASKRLSQRHVAQAAQKRENTTMHAPREE